MGNCGTVYVNKSIKEVKPKIKFINCFSVPRTIGYDGWLTVDYKEGDSVPKIIQTGKLCNPVIIPI